MLACEIGLVHNEDSRIANKLHMHSHFLQNLIVSLALTLIGLVGGLGTGLHLVFDCCHHCEHGHESSSCCSMAHTASSSHHCGYDCCYHTDSIARQRESVTDPCQVLVIPEHDCAICQLLSQFHSTQSECTSPTSVWGNHQKISLVIPSVFLSSTYSQESPRGPPLVEGLACLTLERF